MLRAWPERAPRTACCSSGLNGSTSSSFGGAACLTWSLGESKQPSRSVGTFGQAYRVLVTGSANTDWKICLGITAWLVG